MQRAIVVFVVCFYQTSFDLKSYGKLYFSLKRWEILGAGGLVCPVQEPGEGENFRRGVVARIFSGFKRL